MNIGIIGAGSIGLLFAAYLSKRLTVMLYTRTNEQANEINENGLFLRKGATETTVKVYALPISNWEGKEDLTIVAVKQYQLEAIINKINNLAVSPEALLFIQNGMGHLKLIEQVIAGHIYLASVEHGALKINSYTVSHNGEGSINAALFKGNCEKLQELTTAAPAAFPINIKEDYYEMLLNKLIANAVINPLTAILQVENGQLILNQSYFTVVTKLFKEIAFVFNLENPEVHLKNIMKICEKTANNRSSMLKDLDAGRETELEAILGFVLEKAKIQKMKTPLVESYYFMIKGKERGWGDPI